MNFLKKNIKIIMLIVLMVLISSGIGVFATYNYLASDIKYTDNKTVEQALNDLYDKSANYVLPSGSLDITTNGNNIDVKQYEKVNVNVTSMAKTLLWTNSTPNAEREKFNIDLTSSLDNFTHILIQWKLKTSSSTIYEDIFKINPNRTSSANSGTYGIVSFTDTDVSLFARAIRYVNSTQLVCGNAYDMGGIFHTSYIIPTNIYGLNFSY